MFVHRESAQPAEPVAPAAPAAPVASGVSGVSGVSAPVNLRLLLHPSPPQKPPSKPPTRWLWFGKHPLIPFRSSPFALPAPVEDAPAAEAPAAEAQPEPASAARSPSLPRRSSA